MKKAKIMLTVILVFAVVGGVLAFKAQKFTHKNVFCTIANNNCALTNYKTTADGLAATTTQPCTNPLTGTKITTYFTESQCITKQNSTVYTTNVQ